MRVTITSNDGEVYEVLQSPPGDGQWTDSVGEVVAENDKEMFGRDMRTVFPELFDDARKWERANA